MNGWTKWIVMTVAGGILTTLGLWGKWQTIGQMNCDKAQIANVKDHELYQRSFDKMESIDKKLDRILARINR